MNAMLSIMNLKYEAVGAIVANNGQGIITIDDFTQLNEKIFVWSLTGYMKAWREYRGNDLLY